jgi:outer membrane biosynthesis protein TonB
MKRITLILTASVIAASAAAQEAPQQASPPAEAAPAAATTPAPEQGKVARKAKAAPKAKAATQEKAAAKAHPKPAPEHKAKEMSHQAYLRALAAEIRKHTPRTSDQHSGSVTVAFTIGAAGRVVSHSVKQSSDPALVGVADQILASIHTPPPPGGKFSAVQEFNFH